MESQAENRAKENWERHNMRNRRRKGKKKWQPLRNGKSEVKENYDRKTVFSVV